VTEKSVCSRAVATAIFPGGQQFPEVVCPRFSSSFRMAQVQFESIHCCFTSSMLFLVPFWRRNIASCDSYLSGGSDTSHTVLAGYPVRKKDKMSFIEACMVIRTFRPLAGRIWTVIYYIHCIKDDSHPSTIYCVKYPVTTLATARDVSSDLSSSSLSMPLATEIETAVLAA